MEADITVQLLSPEWKPALKPYCKTVREICTMALQNTKLARLPCRFTMAVVLADDALIKDLNYQYRGKNKATNVLSFPSVGGFETQAAKLTKGHKEWELGDIVLSYATVAREAQKQGKSFRHHAMHLLVHGTLHLLGYDHENESDAEAMEGKEIKILEKLDVKNPYL